MAKSNESVKSLFSLAEKKYGFRFACELHHVLRTGTSSEVRSMVKMVLNGK